MHFILKDWFFPKFYRSRKVEQLDCVVSLSNSVVLVCINLFFEIKGVQVIYSKGLDMPMRSY